VIARRSVWTDATVQGLLAEFVTVADEVGRLQRGKDAECSLFQGFCEQGHYGGRTQPTNTRQGIYAVAPSGKFLASINTQSPERMADMLRTALARWKELPPADRRLDEEHVKKMQKTQRFEQRYPEDGLVLAEYLRDLGAKVEGGDWRTNSWNEDQAWFTRAEAAAMVPASTSVGAQVDVPRRLVERLARLHLIDSVRGQTPSYGRPAVVDAELRSEVLEVDGQRVRLRLAGKTHVQQKGKWVIADRGEPTEHERGVRTDLRGRAVWNTASGRFESFELLAIGERWGATQYNGRPADLAPTPIGFAFVLAAKDHPRVAPAFWWDYDLQ
jgi:hypothetical protein